MTITHPPQHAYPGMPIDLRPEGAALSMATTFPLVKEDAFEAIRMVLRKDHEMAGHQVEWPDHDLLSRRADRLHRPWPDPRPESWPLAFPPGQRAAFAPHNRGLLVSFDHLVSPFE